MPARVRFGKALPAVPHVKAHAALAQAVQPCAQQRRGLHVGGEDAAGAANEGVDAERMHPGAQGFGVESIEQRGDAVGTGAIALAERCRGLGVGQVHAALAGHQELASGRRHGVVDIHGDAARGQYLGRHQAGRATADDDGTVGAKVGGSSGHENDSREGRGEL